MPSVSRALAVRRADGSPCATHAVAVALPRFGPCQLKAQGAVKAMHAGMHTAPYECTRIAMPCRRRRGPVHSDPESDIRWARQVSGLQDIWLPCATRLLGRQGIMCDLTTAHKPSFQPRLCLCNTSDGSGARKTAQTADLCEHTSWLMGFGCARKLCHCIKTSTTVLLSAFNTDGSLVGAQVIDALRPGPDEMVLPKTSSSVFNSTNIDFILRYGMS